MFNLLLPKLKVKESPKKATSNKRLCWHRAHGAYYEELKCILSVSQIDKPIPIIYALVLFHVKSFCVPARIRL